MKNSVRLFVLLALLTASLFIFGVFPSIVRSASTLGDSTHISYGAYIEASIDSLGEVDKYTFDGDSGDVVIIQMNTTTGDLDPRLELFDFKDSLLFDVWHSYYAKKVGYVLPDSGSYTLFTSDYNGWYTGNYWLSLQCRQDVKAKADTLTLNQAVNDSLVTFGQLKAYVFAASENDSVTIRLTRLSGNFEPYLELFNPADSLIASNWGWSQAIISNFVLLTSGFYTIFVSDKDGDATGSYELYINPPPDLIDNSVVRVHFNHSKGMIDEITYKSGSAHELLDQFWNNTNQRGLERIQGENGTVCTYWEVGSDSAVFRYENSMYGSKSFLIKWGVDIGFELKSKFYLTVEDSFSTGALWEPGGDNGRPYDSLVVNDPDSGLIKMMIHYPGGYQGLYYGNSVALGMWDSRYDETFGYRDIPQRYIWCGTGLSMDGPFHEIAGPDTITLEFAIKDSASFWSWAAGYEHNVGVVSILAPAGVVPEDTNLTPVAIVRNYGRVTETFPVTFQIGTAYYDTAMVTLQPGQQNAVSFDNWLADEPGTYITACSTGLADDQYVTNDAQRGAATVSPGAGPEIYGTSPNHGGNTGFVTTAITGAGFEPGATVKLSRTDQLDIIPDTVIVHSLSITAVFDLRSKTLGNWDVIVTNPDNASATFYGGFVIQKGFDCLNVEMLGRDQMRLGRESIYWIRLTNCGNVDLCDLILEISIAEEAQISVDLPYPDTLEPVRDSIPDGVQTDSGFVVPIWILRVASGISYSFPVRITLLQGHPGSITQLKSQVWAIPGSAFGYSGLPKDVESSPTFQSLRAVIDSLYKSSFHRIFAGKNGFKDFLGKWYDIPFIPKPLAFIGCGVGALIGGWAWAGGLAGAGYLVDEGISLFRTLTGVAGNLLDDVSLDIQEMTAWDPNDKAGPRGFGNSHYIAPEQTFTYMVYFENIDSATASAEDIVITDTLDTNLDWSTLTLGQSSHDPTDQSFDTASGVITWTFEDINLPPNVNPPEGEGWVSFAVEPNEDLVSGTRIENLAWVTFDYMTWACPMDSTPIFNTIDALPPSSQISELPDTVWGHEFEVCWSGEDDASGSGIRNYSIYYSVEGGPDSLWLANTTDTCAIFHASSQPVPTTMYAFYSIARDNVGNVEHKDSASRTPIFVGIGEEKEEKLPFDFSLSQNYPNPFNPTSVIQYAIPRQCHVKIAIYNILGRKVRTLVDEEQTAGYRTAIWDSKNDQGTDVSSGGYFYKIKADNFTKLKKMVLLK